MRKTRPLLSKSGIHTRSWVWPVLTLFFSVTAYDTAQILPVSQILDNIESIGSVMKQQKVSTNEREEVTEYLCTAYLRTKRTTISHLAKLLNSIPHRIRVTSAQHKLFSKQGFFQHHEFLLYLVENCRFLYFTPKTYLFRGGDLFIGYFIIKKGFCLEIDLLGNVMVRGPGDSVGMLSLLVGQQLTTVITHTYVHANYIDSTLFVEALQQCPKARCRFEYAFLTLEDRYEIIRDVLTVQLNVEKHEHETALENLMNEFVFTNYPSEWRKAKREGLR